MYPVKIAVYSQAAVGARAGTFDYGLGGDLLYPCGGDLLAEDVSGERYLFHEALTYGIGCVNNGSVDLTRKAALDSVYYESYGPRGFLGASADLSRKEESAALFRRRDRLR